ncbi:MAG: 1,4-alpha-glucan branching enzyme, partial [Pirellulales bacterium]
MRTTLLIEDFAPLVEGRHENPHHVLGPHPVSHEGRKALAVRAYLPHCDSAWVVDSAHNATRPMRRIHPSGFYEAILPARADKDIHDYQLRTADPSGRETTMHDPYAFGNLLTDFDLYLLGEGTHWKSYERLGAQLRRIGDVEGVNFAVWAPNAESVSVIGDFNGWDGRRHMMRKHIPSGVWEMFVPGLGEGTIYKFQIRHGGEVLEKSDPYGFAA